MSDEGQTLVARIARLEAAVDRHEQLIAIEDVLKRYSRALDWLDDEMLETVFFDDAEIDYGFFKGNGRDFKPLLMKIEHSMGRRWHFTSQVKIQLDGDVAEVESYNFSLATEPVDTIPPADMMHFYGFYIDRMARRGGQWGIIRRRHLLMTGLILREIPLDGVFADLNKLGSTEGPHADYRRLSTAPHLQRG